MSRLMKRSRKKLGLSPGTLIHIGDQKIGEVKMSLMNYDPGQLIEKELTSIEDAFPYKDTPPVTWINVDGLHDLEIIEAIGRHFGIHPLTLEDIVNTGHRPKAEDFEDYDYIVLKMLTYNEDQNHILAEQISFILGPHYLISFQETEGDVFNFVRERIRKAKGRIRKSGCDYLAYALIDAIVDHYFLVLEKMGGKIELLEEDLLDDTQTENLQSIHHLKREMIFFRKQVWPIREILSSLMKEEGSLIQETTQIFIRDLYDHTIQVMDTIESFRDVLSGLQDLYLSTISNRMNEVMKVLTIMATIFIPLTFIAGIYGMNFEYMPELKISWAYPALWILLIAIFLFMIFWFKRKRWL